MKLSMWMLADWLADYKPESMIASGERALSNVRLLPAAPELSRSTLYLSTDGAGNVLCVNGRDIIVLEGCDVDEALNEILDAFDFYNEWEARFHDTIQAGCGLRELLELGSIMIGRLLVVTDATYYVRDYGGDAGLVAANQAVAQTLTARTMPLEPIMRINAMPHVRSRRDSTYALDIPELDTQSAVTNLFVDGKHEGWLVSISAEQSCTQATLDMQEGFAEALLAFMRVQAGDERRMDRSAVFSEVLDGTANDEDSVYRRLATLGWGRDDQKAVYRIRQLEQARNPHHVVGRYLEQVDSSAAFVEHEGDMAFFVKTSASELAVLEPQVQDVLRMCGCAAGRSPLFSDIFLAPGHFGAARVASRSAKTVGAIVGYQDVKLSYAISLVKGNAVAPVTHDAIAQLAAYDAANNAELELTLRRYVEGGCNAAGTARELFIHRSTFLYRLERIVELTGLDLDDPDELFLLQLSYRLDA